MVGKNTRELLIDVARRLFAKIGVERTTMNDIAVASNKGRRTLYTYFKSKEEVYEAVVEHEIQKVVDNLKGVLLLPLSSQDKLARFFLVRMDSMKEIVVRNGTLRAYFFRNVQEVEHVRQRLYAEEYTVLCEILQEGVDNGAFEIGRTELIAKVLQYSLKGLDIPYIKGAYRHIEAENQEILDSVLELVFNGILKKQTL